jgi:hypothetical protein
MNTFSLLANGIDPKFITTKSQCLKDATEHTFQAVAKKWLMRKSKRQASPKTMLRHLAKPREKYLPNVG